jgi:hypothetical protein
MRIPSIGSSLIATFAFVTLNTACSDDSGLPTEAGAPDIGHALLGAEAGVTLRAEADRFEPGAPVTLVLENGSGNDVGYNLCVHELEERTADGWVLKPLGHACILPLFILGPSASTTYEASLPEDLGPGEYRFRIGLYLDDGEGRDQVSNTFEIEG